MELINIAKDLWFLFSSGMSGVYNILSTPLNSLISGVDIFIVTDLLVFAVNKLGIGDVSIVQIMFSVGLPLIIIVSISKWLIGVFK